ncbi:unnamed protein product [Sphagnum troendelagicum]|uniref:Phospho-2-dehydro-3-deoxyheptonate aldolase n=1 Tax=Sphagnum troendelagicum TaxID=128251 RepID=A0ABP0TGN0_9BRYO
MHAMHSIGAAPPMLSLLSYRGDNIKGDGPDLQSWLPNPERMVHAYSQAPATLNILRALATGGYAANAVCDTVEP